MRFHPNPSCPLWRASSFPEEEHPASPLLALLSASSLTEGISRFRNRFSRSSVCGTLCAVSISRKRRSRASCSEDDLLVYMSSSTKGSCISGIAPAWVAWLKVKNRTGYSASWVMVGSSTACPLLPTLRSIVILTIVFQGCQAEEALTWAVTKAVPFPIHQ